MSIRIKCKIFIQNRFISSQTAIQDLKMNKTSNKPQVVKRGIAGLKTNAINLIEKGSVPFLAFYFHPESSKCSLLGDDVTIKLLEKTDIVHRVEQLLFSSHKSGQSLKIFDREVENERMRKENLGQLSDNEKQKYCHLPEPVYRLVSERYCYDYDMVRELLSSALACEGFGRGSGNLDTKSSKISPLGGIMI